MNKFRFSDWSPKLLITPLKTQTSWTVKGENAKTFTFFKNVFFSPNLALTNALPLTLGKVFSSNSDSTLKMQKWTNSGKEVDCVPKNAYSKKCINIADQVSQKSVQTNIGGAVWIIDFRPKMCP